MHTLKLSLGSIALVLCHAAGAVPQAPESTNAQPGHSFHAEAFNEGPRQAAYLMPGMGNVHWQSSTPSPMAQRFLDQGLSQLHGFWYFEAERSFRQAAAIDPECPIHYWGIARANVENPERSAGFIEQAMRRIDAANKLERRLIEAWSKRVKDWPTPPKDAASDQAASTADQAASTADAKAKNHKKKPKSPPVTDEIRDRRKQRLKDYAKELEDIAVDYPNDVEVKAMLVLQYWQNQSQGIEIQSHLAIDALLSEIFRANPHHPAQHFRIHLWDYRKEDLAISAAAECGPSAPGIAHMWHMPGHTYSRLNRYFDAAWQQEASARVDHAHMMRDRVMPDQIHNYAHNNEWLIRNWLNLGAVSRAIELSKNMIELPRHPQYNAPDGNGSANLGRQRLLQSLRSYRRWEKMLELAKSRYLDGAENTLPHEESLGLQGIALTELGKMDEANALRTALVETRRRLRSEWTAISPPDTSTAKILPPTLDDPTPVPDSLYGSESESSLVDSIPRDFDEAKWKSESLEVQERERKIHALKYRHHRLGVALTALDAHLAAARGDFRTALRLSNHTRSWVDSHLRMEWCCKAGDYNTAVQQSQQSFDGAPGQVLPAAILAWITNEAIAHQPDSKSLAQWQELRKKAAERCFDLAWTSDPDETIIERVQPIASPLVPDKTWRARPTPPKDLGDRPPLDTLGPIRWSPAIAPRWHVTAQPSTQPGGDRSSQSLEGKPYILILYLGFGCLHCAEQLRDFSPATDKFRQAGIEIVGISTENANSLAEALKRYDGQMNLALAPNPDLDVFKSFRCFDDFEGQPLHGTILVDGKGRIRWQDIGYEPFMDVGFLHEEATRLLALPE